jgi:glycosyltransferase involved in cell wall biosynthesis
MNAVVPVHFRGVVLGPSGFAAQGRDYLRCLDAAGLQPSLEGARLGAHGGGESADDQACIARCAARPRRSGAVVVHHMLPAHFAPGPDGGASALVTVFETETLPRELAANCNRAAVIAVPTDFVADAFARGGIPRDKLRVVPVPVDAGAFTSGQAPHPALPPRRPGVVRFLSVFDWSLRKGFDLLLAAFGRTFGATEAELVLKVAPHAKHSPEALAAECRKRLRAAATGPVPAVHVLSGVATAAEMPALYAGCDAFALPSRGEAWGRPVHEAMLMQLPVVASAGHAFATLLPDASVG